MKPQEAVVKETGHIAIGTLILTAVMPVSYTHLTLPTSASV